MTRKDVMDILNLKVAELNTLKHNCPDIYAAREIKRAIQELDEVRREIKKLD